MGPGTGTGWGTGIALPGPPMLHHPGYTPPHHCRYGYTLPGHVSQVNSAVGLRSVGQLTLGAQISGFRGMTEVYNLVEIGRINNHFVISQNE